jgi:predicted phosphoribosyltransferase
MRNCYRKYPFSESRNATKASTKIIVAVPVLPYDTLAVFEKILMNLCINSLKNFRGVGRFYEDFQQVEDDEVIRC